MKRPALSAAVACVLALALAGCGAEPGPGQTPPITLPTPAPPGDPMPELPPQIGDVPTELVAQLVDEAAAVASVNPAEVHVLRAEAVTWSDGSLGCPEPDQFYTQALVDGYWVVLEAGGREFDFRGNQAGEFRLCPAGQGVPPLEE